MIVVFLVLISDLRFLAVFILFVYRGTQFRAPMAGRGFWWQVSGLISGCIEVGMASGHD